MNFSNRTIQSLKNQSNLLAGGFRILVHKRFRSRSGWASGDQFLVIHLNPSGQKIYTIRRVMVNTSIPWESLRISQTQKIYESEKIPKTFYRIGWISEDEWTRTL